jgi:3-oxoacyl-[acyl-carrier protein] reductase
MWQTSAHKMKGEFLMKTVLITGGNKGIGMELTRKFVDAVYNVAVAARDFSNFDLKEHAQVRTFEADLSDIDSIPALIQSIGNVDILINNAGMMTALPYNDYPEDKVELTLKLNLQAPAALIRECSAHMIKQGWGRIVNNASIAGHIGHPDIWYGATKAGLINMTKSFAKILGGDGIVVNAVAAGPVETDMLFTIPIERREAIKKAVYTGRFARPEEVSDAMFWLATDCPVYINGTCIDINNGAFPR